MSKGKVVSAKLPLQLYKKLEEYKEERFYRSISEAVVDIIREYLEKWQEKRNHNSHSDKY